MHTQTKQFSIRLISDLLESGNAIDASYVQATKATNVIERYNAQIAQHMVYAIEHDTHIEILQNSTVKPLITLLANASSTEYLIRKRLLANSTISICILSPKASSDDIIEFKKLID